MVKAAVVELVFLPCGRGIAAGQFSDNLPPPVTELLLDFTLAAVRKVQ